MRGLPSAAILRYGVKGVGQADERLVVIRSDRMLIRMVTE
jgi:hypothetical protein